MITPEIIAYIKSQLAAGASRESIAQSLSVQGWNSKDIFDAFEAASLAVQPNPTLQPSAQPYNLVAQSQSVAGQTNQNPAVTKKRWTIGRIILWVFVIGFIGTVLGIAVLGYFAYSNFMVVPSAICAEDTSLSVADRADCEKSIKNFFASVMNNAVNIKPPTGLEQVPTDRHTDLLNTDTTPIPTTTSGSDSGDIVPNLKAYSAKLDCTQNITKEQLQASKRGFQSATTVADYKAAQEILTCYAKRISEGLQQPYQM